MDDLKKADVKRSDSTPKQEKVKPSSSKIVKSAIVTFIFTVLGFALATYLFHWLTGDQRGVNWGYAITFAIAGTFYSTYRSIYSK